MFGKLLSKLAPLGAKLGFGGAAANGATAAVAGATGQGAAQVAAQGAGTAAKGFLGRISSLWKGTPKGVKTVGVVGGGAYAAKEGVGMAVGQSAVGEAVKKGGNYLPWLLGAAAVGGLLIAFWDKIFGRDEPQEAPQAAAAQPSRSVALSPEEQLLEPQMSAPMLMNASSVTASYPVAVGEVASPMVQEVSAPSYASDLPGPEQAETTWQARIGGPRTQHGSYVATEQARAEAAAMQQKVF